MHLSIHWSFQNSILFLLSCVWSYIFRDMHQYSNTSNFGKETHSINHLIKCKIFTTKTAWLGLFFSSLLLLSPFLFFCRNIVECAPFIAFSITNTCAWECDNFLAHERLSPLFLKKVQCTHVFFGWLSKLRIVWHNIKKVGYHISDKSII